MKNIKRFSFVLTILSVVLGVLSVTAPAANADGDGDFHFTVVSAAYDYDAAEFSIDNETRLTVNGATQLTWWYPNHNIKVSMKAVKKAPHIKVRYAPCSRQSKSIAKQAHGASIVVAKPGSVICNTGKNGNIVGGFKWTVKRPAVLKWNKQLRLYQHVYNIVGGKLVKTCGNRMGGHVDVMYPSVVQIRYEQDVQKSGVAKAKTKVYTDVEFGVTCPNGAYFKVKAGASAYGYAQAGITFTERTRATVLGAKKASLTSESHAPAPALDLEPQHAQRPGPVGRHSWRADRLELHQDLRPRCRAHGCRRRDLQGRGGVRLREVRHAQLAVRDQWAA